MDSDDEYINASSSEDSDDSGESICDNNELVMNEFEKQSYSGLKKSVNDFESEMKESLEKRAVNLQKNEEFQVPIALTDDVSGMNNRAKYFDSDSEEEIETMDPEAREKEQLRLLYDPLKDSKDEAWVEYQRRKYHPKQKSSLKPKPLSNSDAVLSCPACFTTLCLDCQRHETYKTQYRAMFTENCNIDASKVMKMPVKSKSKNQHKREASTASEENPEETFHPVHCSACDTHVAMFDRDEVYHFFNVVSSY